MPEFQYTVWFVTQSTSIFILVICTALCTLTLYFRTHAAVKTTVFQALKSFASVRSCVPTETLSASFYFALLIMCFSSALGQSYDVVRMFKRAYCARVVHVRFNYAAYVFIPPRTNNFRRVE